MNALIVTADDFGSAPEVNEAVEIAHRDGILTAASLMVSGAAAKDAVERAGRLPTLGVGLHLVLVDGYATAPKEWIPDLVDATGRFRHDMGTLSLRIAMHAGLREQVRAEVEAQFAAFEETGLPFDHVNAHKHMHVNPMIGRIVMDTAQLFQVKALRVPVEPGSPVGSGWVAAPFAKLLARRARRRGFTLPDHVHGIALSGRMTGERLRRTIAALPEGCNEVYLHPAIRDDFPDHGPGYQHRAEFEGLLDAETRQAVVRQGSILTSFSALAAAAS